jgi:hypothetical protein
MNESMMSRRMVLGMRAVLCGVLCCALLGVNRSPLSSVAASQIQKSSQALGRYSVTRSLTDLSAAVDALDGTIDMSSLNSNNFVATRRALTQAYARTLKQIEIAYDPAFDGNNPKNLPLLCAPLPRSAIGLGCVPPEDVSDPAERDAYIQATKDNDAKREKLRHFLAIHQLDELAMSGLAVTLKFLNRIAPASEGSDFAALDRIISTAGISASRRSKIDAMIYDGAKHQ